MIKVVLVDDDRTILSVLTEYIPWQDYEMCVVGVFSDSREALAYLKQYGADLVFTDLVMPKLTGCELIEQVMRETQQIQFVALSSYDDYKNVKDAFLKGAKDYILKEDLDSESFREVLEKMRRVCELQQQAVHSSERRIQAAASGMRNRTKEDRFSVTLFLIERTELEELLKDELERRRENLRILSLEQAECVLHRSGIRKNQIPWFESLRSERRFNRMTIAYQSSGNGQELAALYYRALEELEERKFFELKGFPGGVKVLRDWDSIMGQAMEELKNCSKGCAVKEAGDVLCAAVEELAKCGISRKVYLEKVIYLLQYFHESFAYLRGWIPCLDSFPYEQILSVSSAREAEVITAEMLNLFLQQFGQIRKDGLISLVKSWLDSNFTEKELGMGQLAKMFHVSESYLSKHFFKANKVRINEYVNALRVERAKLLLSSTQLSIQSISDCIGYNNVEHFSRTFKKIVGLAPNLFRSEEISTIQNENT